MSISDRFNTRNKNIDAIMDMMIATQRENGVEVRMQEVLYDPETNERVNKFQKKRLEAKGVDLSRYLNNKTSSGCGGGCCGKSDRPKSNIERGVFVYNEQDLIDETDDGYICEFCMKIGYDGRYEPEQCDCCDDCETCNDQIRGECDGCFYSHFYNGTSYSSTSEADGLVMKEEDSRILDELESDKPDYEVHYPKGGFTIMNYE